MINNKLKFRAFDDGKMLYQDKVVGYTGNEDLVKIYAFLKVLRGDSILMQYTGLKDKNGKEIYEGDIILWDNEKIVVRYGIQGVDAFEGIGYNLWSHYGQKQDGTRLQSEIEVIGNIYQNPKLLKK